MTWQEVRETLTAVVCAEHEDCFLVPAQSPRAHYRRSVYPNPGLLLDWIARNTTVHIPSPPINQAKKDWMEGWLL